VARHHTEEIIGELENEGTKQSKREAESLQFLLDPGFEERFDEKQKRLVLSSPFYQYTVLGADTETPKVIETYLNYTDWMARLNYVLHPSMMPGPRLMLNNSLRNKKLIPIEVDLKADLEDRFHLRAVHKIQWELTKQDRSLIHHWESLLNNKGMKHVSITLLSRWHAVGPRAHVSKGGQAAHATRYSGSSSPRVSLANKTTTTPTR
jgi:hypothetical protein